MVLQEWMSSHGLVHLTEKIVMVCVYQQVVDDFFFRLLGNLLQWGDTDLDKPVLWQPMPQA